MTTSVLVAGQPDGTEELALASGAPPHVLVPGSAEELDRAASTLDAYAAVLRDTATSLSRIEITGWRGAARAGHDAADDAQPGRWTAAAAALVTAAGALRGYVAHLAPAREVAAEAVRLYEQYTAVEGSLEILTTAVDIQPPDGSSMLVGYRSARLRDADQVGSGGDEGVAPAGGALLGATATTVIPALAHDADAVRRQAIATLVRARGIVRSAGAVATDTLRRAEADAPQARRLWEGTIRPSAAEGAAHHVLDVVSLAPGPVGIGAAGTNAAWYAASPYGSSDQAAYAVAGAIPFGKLAKEATVLRGATAGIEDVAPVVGPRLDSKAAIAERAAAGLDEFACDFGLTKVGDGLYRSEAGLIYGPIVKGGQIVDNRLSHVLYHGVNDSAKLVHTQFVGGTSDIVSIVDAAWRARLEPVLNDASRYEVDLAPRVVGSGGETRVALIVKASTTLAPSIISAYPIP